ncbi:acyl-CoA carboxylase subunit beta [Halobacillus mangrovi]|uniref:Methylmalonyl-CoA decarboxylase n=1 Tax=Halobacillus mangrovi TaxID=402384 RepID=A0A1W5ZUB8_9BACI|nr:carboxyl transferase domain-containing protein [Halobacillus mangrovi]ARI76896.1 methylmalonyl-CoA decarboxylase [Halobacillus mangrovi]
MINKNNQVKEASHKQKERMTYNARERIELLADEGSFWELGTSAHSSVPGMEERTPADGLIGGIIRVDGREAVVQAMDVSVLSGTEGEVHLRKSEFFHSYAKKRKLPLFNLCEGGGLRMPDGMGSDGISDKLFPSCLLDHSRESPIMTAILGESYGGPTWMAVTSDFVTQVRGTGMAVAGPRMLEMASGEHLTAEELGGPEMHAVHTGQIDHIAENEQEAIEALRRFFSYMPSSSDEQPDTKELVNISSFDHINVEEIVPANLRQPYDIQFLIKALFDEGSFMNFRSFYGKALITGIARLNGRVMGIVANQPLHMAGAPGPEECDKAVDFICLCDSYHIPLVFLHDTPGFRISSRAEKQKMPSKIMNWNTAIAKSTVPKYSIVIRKSIGAAYGNMCGPGMGADVVAAWPHAEINFTGPEVGVNVVYGKYIRNSEDPHKERAKYLEQWNFDSSPHKAAGNFLIQEIIEPSQTRSFLIRFLESAYASGPVKSKRRLADWPMSH